MGLKPRNPADSEMLLGWHKLVRNSIRCLREIDQFERDLAWWNENRAEPGAQIRFDDEGPEHHRGRIRETLLKMNLQLPMSDDERDVLMSFADGQHFVVLQEARERLQIRGLRLRSLGNQIYRLRGTGEPFFLEYAQAMIGRGPWIITREARGG